LMIILVMINPLLHSTSDYSLQAHFSLEIRPSFRLIPHWIRLAFAEFDPACDNVPPEWWTVDNGVPTEFNRDAVREFLGRFMDNDFWRMA